MSNEELAAYNKRCRAPFTDAWGKSTLPKHPKYVDASYLARLAEITSKVPEPHRQGFIRLQHRILGIKVLKPSHEK